ncbi:hypothetical protein KM043_005351 [Ampulex compressa]|nr:hypothetical protein KM043_005351 [Ampulex compressa]
MARAVVKLAIGVTKEGTLRAAIRVAIRAAFKTELLSPLTARDVSAKLRRVLDVVPTAGYEEGSRGDTAARYPLDIKRKFPRKKIRGAVRSWAPPFETFEARVPDRYRIKIEARRRI